MSSKSQVELMSPQTYQNCSYCSTTEGSAESWLQSMEVTPDHYQLLLDRGWRRIGNFICKPIVDKACCRQYAIRSEALGYRISKSQRRILKKMRNFLKTEGDAEMNNWKSKRKYPPISEKKEECPNDAEPGAEAQDNPETSTEPNDAKANEHTVNQNKKNPKRTPRKGLGADPSKPPCIKSKIRKREKAAKSQQQQPLLENPDPYQTLRSLIPHLNPSVDYKRKLEVVLIQASEDNPQFQKTARESFKVFVKFQNTVLKEAESDWSFSKWSRCFIDCPVPYDESGTGPGYGNFHQQYILDGKIIAVGVITLIPNALVTEYFYYDPDYGFLTLGVYSALNEICYMNELHLSDKRIKRYYLGAYTHTSPKMRYKLQFAPAQLLCPHTYKWISVNECHQFLVDGTARLNPADSKDEPSENEIVKTTFDMDRLAVYYEWDYTTYHDYVRERFDAIDFSGEVSSKDPQSSTGAESYQLAEMVEELELLKEYVSLVGAECASCIHLKVPPTVYPI